MAAMTRRIAGLAGLFVLAASSLPAQAGTSPQERENIRVVTAFYDAAINRKDFAVAQQYLGDRYIQHNPTASDGKDGLEAFLMHLKAKAPQYHSDIVKVLADDDYVVLHVKNSPAPDAQAFAVMDIFRLEHGKIVEHWDVKQPIPETSANGNGMF